MSGHSSFHGRLQEIAGVSVDNFSGDNVNSRAFFLSHCHTDHMQGLFGPDLQRALRAGADTVRVYMSEHSAAIVRREASAELSSAITVLELATVHIRLPATENLKEEYVSVTAVPAGHCLGSVMLLFQTSRDQNVLYTGDFRISANDVSKYAQLHSHREPIKIDALYIDTTFLAPQYSSFPKRTDCMDELVRRITEWLEKAAENRVALSTSAKYGYEYVYMELSQRLNMKVFVDANKWDFYRQLKFMESAVTNDDERSRVHACRHLNEQRSHALCGVPPGVADTHKFLFIRMSAQRFKHYENTFPSPVQKTSETRLDVCFPTHCSRSEIKTFVEYYAPRRIVGFPNDYDANANDRKRDYISSEPNVTPRKAMKAKSGINSPFAKKSRNIDVKEDRATLKELFGS